MKDKFNKILESNEEFKIWEKLDNGCYIGTIGFSEKNVLILYELLKSFEEQYGEVIDYEAAYNELKLYDESGKLFIYFDHNMRPVSMNGCVFNYPNETVLFLGDKSHLSSVYFYGLSTIPEYRGKGACRTLINYAIDFAFYNNFDYVYARTDLINSNSEWLMERAGMEVCLHDNLIIAEWVPVVEEKGDFRLHLWKPLKPGLFIQPKGNAFFATNDSKREIVKVIGDKKDSQKLKVYHADNN